MEIERINDNTVKFYVSYMDIEERGFDREEIWYNRDKSEELFWEMMDEVHQEEEFTVEGPLWIQVQALDKGLEILVTRAHMTKDGQRFELPVPEEKLKDIGVDGQIEDFLDEHFQMKSHGQDDSSFEFMLQFADFEDIISLSKRPGLEFVQTSLYAANNKYYLYVEFPEDDFTEDLIEDTLSILLEYGRESHTTVHWLQEYGKTVMKEDVFSQVQNFFA
ncbi:adaptor protein MecA [Mangrovibacillus cuniculi]|uniref:Adapter protein MecA n=1 Tax=Mangrovibacillus cuniculi TaxID=2593652 RepID=A0A7S8C9Y6_9BACI|nr:adaptor protein MecA [Mangrovibacillus cuniculi]QPC46077.1 adaptor protein MecA [Mangrovibacillus cuniculi]